MHAGPAAPLVVTGARKSFGAVQALDGVSLAVGSGELVGLLGPNGAGKTTLIRAIAGRLALDAGSIHLYGRELTREDERPALGVVPQELATYPLLTARENLDVFGRLYGVGRAAIGERVRAALEWADLAARADEPTKRFSGGMRRRLNIACSLVHEPSVVLLDEPTVGVDPQSRERIYDMLASLRARGVSIVLTTHHLEEAEQRCERIVIIDRGRIAAAGTLRELVAAVLGEARRVSVSLGAAWPGVAEAPGDLRVSPDGRALSLPVSDAATDTRRLLDLASAGGVPVQDISMHGASLQDVFIALTGRDLRE
jgi:linearmycin/streptolysin S transport system ATP-binding protein